MRKLLLAILFFLICSISARASTLYGCTEAGTVTWNTTTGAFWVTSTGAQAACTGGAVAGTGNDLVLNAASTGNWTLNANFSENSITTTGMTGTFTMGTSHTLTLAAGATLAGAFSGTTSLITMTGGGLTLSGAVTGSGVTLTFTTAGQTIDGGMVSGYACSLPLNLNFAGVYALASGHSFQTTGGLTFTLAATLNNGGGSEKFSLSNALVMTASSAAAGSAPIYITGTTTITGGAKTLFNQVHFNGSGSNITESGQLTVTSLITFDSSDNIVLGSSYITANGGITLNADEGHSSTTSFYINAATTLTSNGYQFYSPMILYTAAGTTTFPASSTWTNNGLTTFSATTSTLLLTPASATLTTAGGLTLTTAMATTSVATINVTGGTLSGNYAIYGPLDIGTATVSGSLTYRGTNLTLNSSSTITNSGCALNIGVTTLTSNSVQWPAALTFGVAGTVVLVGNWYTGGLTTVSVGTALNHTSTETYVAAGGITTSAALTGNVTQLYIEGGTWSSAGYSTPIEVNTTIYPAVSNVTLSPTNLAFGGTNTLTYTASTYSVITTGSTLSLYPSGTVTFATTGMTFNNIAALNLNSLTLSLPSTFTVSGTISSWLSSVTFNGATTINCANISAISDTYNIYTWTFAAGTTINVSNEFYILGGITYAGADAYHTFKSATTSPIYLNYSGTLANEVVTASKFQYVNASGSSVPIYDYGSSGNLTGTTNIYEVNANNINSSRGYAYGG